MAVSEAWIGLIGALGGVAVTGVLGLVTAILTQRWTSASARLQRRHELLAKRAELRRDAYARMLQAAQVLGDAAESWEPPHRSLPLPALIDAFYRERPELLNEYAAAEVHAKLLAGDSVDKAIRAFSEWLSDRIGEYAVQWSQKEESEVDYAARVASADEVENRLLAAIRTEQRADLVDEVVTGS